MVEAWVDGGAKGATIPVFPASDLSPWDIARHSRPSGPLRQMYKQSLDGFSADEWYDGLFSIDVHLSSGPVNRFFFFLSAGASSDKASLAHSVYLPEGMTGIGNDRAARIWYRALTQYLVPNSDFTFARNAAMAAAADL